MNFGHLFRDEQKAWSGLIVERVYRERLEKGLLVAFGWSKMLVVRHKQGVLFIYTTIL